MRAVVIHEYGDEDVLRVEEVPVPEPGEREVRIRVAAAAVNRTDLVLRAGLSPRPAPEPGTPGHTFGMDVSGVVDALGAGVTELQVGDTVVGFAGPPVTATAQAEQVVLPAAAVTRAPTGVPLTQAATLPLNGLTAAQALAQTELPSGATVVVTGAAGGLGVFMLQLAHLAGYRVIAWVKPGTDAGDLRRLGAAEVITSANEATNLRAEAVYDAATLGQETIDVLRDNGTYVTFRGKAPTLERGIRQVDVWVHNNGTVLQQLVQSVESGSLHLSTVEEFPLEQVAAAHRRFLAGGLRDRLVLVP